jgi:hypothetical protein
MLTAARFKLGMKPEINEGVLAGSRDDEDRAAAAAVAAIRPAARDVLLATEAQASLATIPGGNVNVDLVDEHEISIRLAAGCGLQATGAAGDDVRSR